MDFLPKAQAQAREQLAASGDGELWVKTIEKANAERFEGGYEGYDSGSHLAAYEQLTGGPPQLAAVPNPTDVDLDAYAKRLDQGEAIVTNTWPSVDRPEFSNGIRDLDDDKNIMEHHIYSVSRIDSEIELVCLDNPHEMNDLVLIYSECLQEFGSLQCARTRVADGQ